MNRNERLMLEEIGWAIGDGAQLTDREGKFLHSMHRCAMTDDNLNLEQHAMLRRIWERIYKKDGKSQKL